MTRILSADLLIADVILPLEGNAQLWPLVEKYGLRPGDKRLFDEAQMKECAIALEGVSLTVTPGGSSANMLTTLSKLLGKEVEIRFLGVAGEGQYSSLIRQSFVEAGITLMPERFPPGHVSMQSGVSFVFIYPDGQCTIATYPGNAREVLKPAMVAEHLVKNSEVLLVQGSLWRKFHPEFLGRLLKLRERHNRELWLTLPTQLDITVAEREKFMEALPAATLVFGNELELERLYGLPINQSLQHLQKTLRDHERAEEQETGIKAETLGFITFGKEGAAVVTPHVVDRVPPVKMEEKEIINTLGAGDTAYAAFAAGYLRKLPPIVSGQIAMTLASEKLRVMSSRLTDPQTAINTLMPDYAHSLRN